MNLKIIEHIIEQKAYPDVPSKVELIETHISWVLLTENFAFKIKKPIQYSFLSFTTLEKRKFYCEKEVRLNRRLCENIYLGVVPIYKNKDSWTIAGEAGEIVDYAVKMKKLDSERRMDILLKKGLVTRKHVEQLADKLASFHAFTDSIKGELLLYNFWLDFSDILKVKKYFSEKIGEAAGQKIEEIVQFAKLFLEKYKRRITERHQQGFTVDGHGDLHSRNIFLLKEPVIFDCIEFNDHFRQVDVLNEIAFLCMDLDFYKETELQMLFFEQYQLKYPCIVKGEDFLIFQYYKLYRANVRAKVNALKAMQEEDPIEVAKRMKLCEAYFQLMVAYYSILSKECTID
jgi:uncharacterized protein